MGLLSGKVLLTAFVAVTIRFMLYFAKFGPIFQKRVEVSTPINSWLASKLDLDFTLRFRSQLGLRLVEPQVVYKNLRAYSFPFYSARRHLSLEKGHISIFGRYIS